MLVPYGLLLSSQLRLSMICKQWVSQAVLRRTEGSSVVIGHRPRTGSARTWDAALLRFCMPGTTRDPLSSACGYMQCQGMNQSSVHKTNALIPGCNDSYPYLFMGSRTYSNNGESSIEQECLWGQESGNHKILSYNIKVSYDRQNLRYLFEYV